MEEVDFRCDELTFAAHGKARFMKSDPKHLQISSRGQKTYEIITGVNINFKHFDTVLAL